MIRQTAVLLLLLFGAAFAAERPYMLTGNAIQGGVLIGKTQAGAKVWQDGRLVRVSPEGHFLIGFDRDEDKTSRLEVLLPDGRRGEEAIEVAQREYRIQRIDGLPPGKVTPRSKEDLKRIRDDAAKIRRARSRDDDRTDFLGGFDWPVTGPISGVYGSQRILNGKPRRPHYGVDIARPTGTPVHAPVAGVVTLAEPDMFFSGGTVIIDHGHQLSSAFLHMSRLHVEPGQVVRKGELIGEVGATGRVTGAHLDWRMNLGDRRVDPELLVPPMPK